MGQSPETVDRLRTSAHRHSLEIGQQDLVEALCVKLGIRLVAFLAGRDESTISRWRNGHSTADEAVLLPLRQCYQIFKMLERTDADATIRAWFIGTNPQLDDESPVEAIQEGRYRETMAAARAFLTGA